MASAKKKDEMNLKSLRELTSLDHNKKCLECGQRGITYADMTTTGFVCVQCSGYLRGLNPPHRVKSISMTSFSDKELEQLKEGGNEVSRKVWLGNWNPSKDREPDKKDEQAFKEFLCTKYERRQWYKSLAEVRREEESNKAPPPSAKSEVKIQPPPGSRSPNVAVERPQAVQAAVTPPVIQACTAPVMPATTTVSTNAQAKPAAAPKVDLLGELEGDPFASKKPVGGVSVFAGMTNAPLLPANGPAKQDDFGAFTSALYTSSSSSSSSAVTLQPSSSSAVGGSSGDKYAELKSLDYTFRELRVKDEPSPQMPRAEPPQGAGGVFGSSSGPTNPFLSSQSGSVSSGSTQAQYNPFMSSGGGQPQGVSGSVSGGGSGWGGGQGGGFPQQQQQQQPAQQQQQWGGGGIPQQGQQQGWMVQQGTSQAPGTPQMQQQWGGGGPVQQMPPQQQQQWGGMPQQQGQQQNWMMQQGGGAAPGSPQVQQWGGGGPMQQQQMPPQQQQQWGGQQQQPFNAQQGGMQFGGQAGMQQQQPVAGGFPQNMQPQQQGNQFGGFVGGGMPQQQQQQQQQQKPANQYDWSGVNATLKQKAPPSQFSWDAAAAQPKQPAQPQKKYINWGGGVSRIDNSSSDGSFSSTSATSVSGSGSNSGWSDGVTKPVNSGWGSQVSQQTTTNSMGWSSNVASVNMGGPSPQMQQGSGSNWGANSGGASVGGGFGQQSATPNAGFGGMGMVQQNQMGGANPFASVSQSGPTNPFL